MLAKFNLANICVKTMTYRAIRMLARKMLAMANICWLTFLANIAPKC